MVCDVGPWQTELVRERDEQVNQIVALRDDVMQVGERLRSSESEKLELEVGASRHCDRAILPHASNPNSFPCVLSQMSSYRWRAFLGSNGAGTTLVRMKNAIML